MSAPLMIFAAGRGTRMQALTADRPKPLLQVAGRALIDYALDLADDIGAAPVVINLHYCAEMLRDHLADRSDLNLRYEPVLLETGGGLRAARDALGQGPVLTLNSDALWWGENPLHQLQSAYDPTKMDALLLLVPTAQTTDAGPGDFFLHTGVLRRRGGASSAPYIYAGAQMINPDVLNELPDKAFSLNLVWDRLIAADRVRAVVYSGKWLDVGTPVALARAQSAMQP